MLLINENNGTIVFIVMKLKTDKVVNSMKVILSVAALFWCISSSFSQETNQQNEELILILDSVFHMEQDPIRKRDALMDKYGAESEQAEEYQKIYKENHQINEQIITRLLDEFGWLGPDIIGSQGNRTLFLVIQHSGLNTRQKYLPMLREAVKKGDALPLYLAGVEDRVATDLGKLQVYGNQVKYYPETKSFDVWPIIDPENVDKRRAEIGLGPISEHLKNRFKLTWDLEKQIKRSQEFAQNNNLENK